MKVSRGSSDVGFPYPTFRRDDHVTSKALGRGHWVCSGSTGFSKLERERLLVGISSPFPRFSCV